MLEFRCDTEYVDAVGAFATLMGLASQLQDMFEYLDNYGGGINKCVMGKDFAPHSFAFTRSRPLDSGEDGTWRPWFSGGLIYQGPDCPANGGAPSWTISLATGTGWFIHT